MMYTFSYTIRSRNHLFLEIMYFLNKENINKSLL